MRAFARAVDQIGSSPSRLEKAATLAQYLADCSDDDLEAAARFFTGSPLPPGEQTKAAIGSRTIEAAACMLYGIDQQKLKTAYREHGDLGEALAACYAPPLDLGFFIEELTPAKMLAHLRAASGASGKNANTTRQRIVENMLRACTSNREVAAVVKILTGDLRIGSRESLLIDAIAQAFARPVADVRRAFAANVDAGIVALAARYNRIDKIKPSYGTPLGMMLASPMAYRSAYKEVLEGAWVFEDKFDGIRAQIHVTANVVQIFSRTGGDITASFPELHRACTESIPSACILDGEIIAMQDERPLPFRMLQPRLSRKAPTAEMLAAIPAVFIAFDLLADGDSMIIDEPLHMRRSRLTELAQHWQHDRLRIASSNEIAQPDPLQIETAFSEARLRGNEGLMLKHMDSPYTPGRRGKSWIKLKQELDTLDVVVVGVEWGHGKRVKMLSDYTFAVRDGEKLVTIGKAYSGLTDAEIIELTPWFLARQTGMLGKRTLAVSAERVIEIAFDILQPSEINESGFSLRFPRIVRIRTDKSLQDISTMDDVKELYRLMLEREAGKMPER